MINLVIIGIVILVLYKLSGKPARKSDEKNFGIRKQLTDKWGIRDGDSWIPLDDAEITDSIEYGYYSTFAKEFGIDRLKKILQNITKSDVYEINNEASDRRIAVSEIDFKRFECYYTNETADWVVYYSHEDTITFAGQELIEKLQATWEGWETYRRKW
jgi:hypothetical protein